MDETFQAAFIPRLPLGTPVQMAVPSRLSLGKIGKADYELSRSE